eukprot:2553404-Pyramimonas_sp.AAC.1
MRGASNAGSDSAAFRGASLVFNALATAKASREFSRGTPTCSGQLEQKSATSASVDRCSGSAQTALQQSAAAGAVAAAALAAAVVLHSEVAQSVWE